jgi:hypothetical protein
MSDDLPHQVEVRPDNGTIEFTLKAMAHNYSGGHCWDHLDGTACATAAATITELRAEVATLRARVVEVEAERDGWQIQLGKIAALVPISQIVRVTGTTKDLIEWLTDRVAVAAKAEAAEANAAALRAALTPSGDTKAAYMGEIKDPETRRMVSWTAIKMVMAMVLDHSAKKGGAA